MGSKSTQETKIPAYIEEAGKKALERAQQIQDLGYVPYMGPEIAEISETERALNRNVGAMASAFGLEGPAPLTMGDAEVTSAGGVSGYSSYPAYMSALQRLQEQRPDQYAYLAGLGRFDPITGAAIAPPVVPEVATGPLGVSPVSGGGGDDGPFFAPTPSSSGSSSGRLFGGFTSVKDMFDGGGAGASGDTYSSGRERGPISRAIFGD
jgi:hypothetical protein